MSMSISFEKIGVKWHPLSMMTKSLPVCWLVVLGRYMHDRQLLRILIVGGSVIYKSRVIWNLFRKNRKCRLQCVPVAWLMNIWCSQKIQCTSSGWQCNCFSTRSWNKLLSSRCQLITIVPPRIKVVCVKIFTVGMTPWLQYGLLT